MCRGALRSSSRLAPAGRVPPPSRVRVYTRAHQRARAAPGYLQLVHEWAHAPLSPAVPGHLRPQGCLCLTRSVDTPRDSPGVPHNFLRSPTRSPDPCWDFRTPGRTPGRGVPRTCARRRAHPLQLASAAPPHPADPCPFTFHLCPFTGWVLSWRCPRFFSHPSLVPHFCARV